MKKILLLPVILCLTISFVFSQNYYRTITIKGTVTNLADKAIPGHSVTIMSDSIYNINFFHYKKVITDNNGVYMDTVKIPYGPNFDKLTFVVWTVDCKNQYLNKTLYYSINHSDYIADFKICNIATPECKANFTVYRDSSISSSRYAYRFFGNSRGGTAFTWHWDFGDNTSSNEQNPLHKFEKPGVYYVCLKITTSNNNGIICEDTYCSKLIIADFPPPPPPPYKCAAYFTFSNQGGWNDSIFPPIYKNSVYFTDMSRASNILHWFWTFGDRTNSTLKNPMHKYEKPGVYEVCLKITSVNPDGTICENTYCAKVTVGDYPPPPPKCIASFYYFPYTYWNDTINPGDSIQPPAFKDNTYFFISTSQGGNNMKYFWDFGDSTSSNEQNPIHTFPDKKTYKVCLTITSEGDSINFCTDTYCIIIESIPVNKCIADFYYLLPDSTTGNLMVQFQNTSKGTADRFFWDFGDGNSSQEENPLHIFNKSGYYNVCLTIKNDSLQCKDSRCMKIFVGQQPHDCKAFYTFHKIDTISIPEAPKYFQFVNQSRGNAQYYYWDFGDGSYSVEMNPQHMFANTGYYNVCLTISDSTNAGCWDSYCDTIFIGKPNVYCKAKFYTWLDSAVNTLNLYRFVDISQGFHNKTYWEFGDGFTSYEKNPSHQYKNPGIYNVCLTILNDSMNCKDVLCKTIYIQGNPGDCKVSFKYYLDTTAISIPEVRVYKFIPISPVSNGQYLWNFGDGSTSNEMSPSHGFNFMSGETYHVCLTAIFEQDSNRRCTATDCQKLFTDSIIPPPFDRCKSSFTYNIANSDSDLIVTFNAHIINPKNFAYNWDFGDSTVTSTLNNTITHAFTKGNSYNVCLTTTSLDSSMCTFTSCQIVSGKNTDTSAYYGNMSGQIFAGKNYADKGYVTIVKMDKNTNGGISYYGVAQIEADGRYSFNKIPYGTYYVRAKLYSGSQYYSKYIPTYYGDKWSWSASKTVSIGDFAATDNIDIHLIPLKSIKNGKGHISGIINDDDFKSAKGTPVANVEVYLMDDNDNPILSTYTDSKGYFIFSDMDYGTYKVFVEVFSLISIPKDITLDTTNSSAENVDFTINKTKVNPASATSVQYINVTSGNKFSEIYPNPAGNIANINIVINKSNDVKIDISNQIGQTVYNSDIKLNSGSSIVKINTADFTKGLYIIRISGNDINVIRRFVKVN